MPSAKALDAIYRMGGRVGDVVWLTSMRGSPLHPKITHAFIKGLSECHNAWSDESLPPREWPPQRICAECQEAVLLLLDDACEKPQNAGDSGNGQSI